MNRVLNAAMVNDTLSDEARTELARLDRESIDAFNAISHHLPANERQLLDTQRTALEQGWLAQGRFAPRESHAHTERMLNAVDGRLRAILTG